MMFGENICKLDSVLAVCCPGSEVWGRVPCCTGQPPEAFPSWGSVPEPTCIAVKKQTLSLKNCNAPCRFHPATGQVWVTPSQGSGI